MIGAANLNIPAVPNFSPGPLLGSDTTRQNQIKQSRG